MVGYIKRKKGVLLAVLLTAAALVCVGLFLTRTARAEDEVDIDATFPDENFREYVHEVIDTSGNGTLSKTEIAAVRYINITHREIESIEGVEIFYNLADFEFDHNNVKTADLSHNRKITYLSCMYNELEFINVTKLTLLDSFYCCNNKLTDLDVSNCPKLSRFDCSDNLLREINLKGNPEMADIYLYNNLFETLDFSECPYLLYVNVANNRLRSIDISKCPYIWSFSCANNQITSLDVTKNPVMTYLTIANNPISSIDLTRGYEVEVVNCSNTLISELNVGGLTRLQRLFCENCRLTELNLINNRNLKELYCSGNNISKLLYLNETAIETLSCYDTNLTSLNVSDIPTLKYINCMGTPMHSLVIAAPGSDATLECYVCGAVEMNIYPDAQSSSDNVYKWYYKERPSGSWKLCSTSYPRILNVPITSSLNEYEYRCTIEKASGNSATGIVRLHTRVSDCSLYEQADPSVPIGNDVEIFTSVSGPNDREYTWLYREDPDSDWKIFSEDRHSQVLRFKAASGYDGWSFRCLVEAKNNSFVFTKPVTLEVTPWITKQPESAVVAVGTTAKFTTKGYAVGSVSYQWQTKAPGAIKWNNSTAASAKTATFSLNAQLGHNGYMVRCIVKDSKGRFIPSKAVKLTVKNVTGPQITKQPSDVTVSVGAEASFTVAATGTGTITYQWQTLAPNATEWKNSTNATAKKATFKLTAQAGHNNYKVRCIVNDGTGVPVPSAEAKLTVQSGTGPKITTQPKSVTVAVGETASFTVAATGTGTLSYQWQTLAPGATEWRNSTNATAKKATFKLTAQAGHNGYKVRCIVTDSKGDKTSNEATLTVSTTGPTITTQPKNKTVSAGAKASFTVAATGTGKLSYQWQTLAPGSSEWKNSTNATAKKATFKITAQAGHNGYKVRCIVTDSKGSTPSSDATLTVN